MDTSGRISKHGDAMVRSLLYEAANSMLTGGAQGPSLEGRSLEGPSLEGLGAPWIRKQSGHKKACVALARKLAVILHRMLTTGAPFRWPEKPEKKDAARA